MSDTSIPARRATIYDIARAAGVSHTTVSRYLRFDGHGLKAATRERIQTALAELDYRPNLAARAMRNGHTGRVAIVLPPGIAASSMRMLAGATAVAHAAGEQVEVVTFDGPADVRSARVREIVESGLYEGVLSLTPTLTDGLPEGTASTPLVVSAAYDEERRVIGEFADASPMAEIIETLVGQGHRRFLHVAGDAGHAASRGRQQVYTDTIERLGVESAGVVGGDWLPETASQAILDLPNDCGVTAVLAANDVLAGGAIQGALSRGWRIPQDLSVTGWDNNPLGALLNPTLTSVEVGFEELGSRSMGRLLADMNDTPAPEVGGSVSTVVWRSSTGPAPRRRRR